MKKKLPSNFVLFNNSTDKLIPHQFLGSNKAKKQTKQK